MASGIVTVIQSGPPALAIRDSVGEVITDQNGELIIAEI